MQLVGDFFALHRLSGSSVDYNERINAAFRFVSIIAIAIGTIATAAAAMDGKWQPAYAAT